MNKVVYAACWLWAFSVGVLQAQNSLPLLKQLQQSIAPLRAIAGIAVMHVEQGDSLTIGNEHRFPMQSVYKFPLAMAVLDAVDQKKYSLKQKIHVHKDELNPDTWSPLAKLYPEGNIEITIEELLHYTVSKSDNNACDVLFKLMGGTTAVESYVHKLGYSHISIKATEAEMMIGADSVLGTNWCYPSEMTRLLVDFFKGRYLTKNSHRMLMKLMIDSENSKLRIMGLLPVNTIVAHKTGTGNRIVNDVGIITLPDGNHVALSVFVKQSSEQFEDTEKLIAKLSKTVYDYYAGWVSISVGLDAIINDATQQRFNGVVLIARQGKTSYIGVNGYKDIANKQLLNVHHQFVIGSISKQMTAVMVLQEVEKGRVQLHVPIIAYLPELKVDWAKKVTIHQLLTHMHGVAALDEPAAFEPGTQFDYGMSNTGYTLLSMILESVTGKSFVRQSTALFKSCGMHNTFHPANKKYKQLVKGYTEANNGIVTVETRSFENHPAAGGFISTAGDLVVWNQQLHQGKLLKPETYQLMVTKKKGAVRQHPIWGPVEYGYGITVNNEGIQQVGQTGFAPGFVSMDYYFPETQTSVIVLENVAYKTIDLKQTFYHHVRVLHHVKNQ